MITTACPLDCWDACGMTVDPAYPDTPVPTPAHPMHTGALCVLLNKHFHATPRIQTPRINGKEVSMEAALDATAEALQSETKLLWRGSGNLGVMQRVTDLLMDRIGGTVTRGSLCDAAGQAGIESGRGYHRMLPPEQIAQAEVVVVWGRNITVTNKHVLPLLQGKRLIVIDPVRTGIAKRADLFMQIRPRSDVYLALLLARFAVMEGSEDQNWLDQHAPDWEDFYAWTQEFRINNLLQHIDVPLETLGDMLYMIQNRKTVFLVGIGPQHYTVGDAVLWAIDSLAAVLGLFGRDGCGVGYMGNARQGYTDPFDTTCRRVSIAATPFEDFETVLVQGGNPAESMPDSHRVISALGRVKNLIYFGLYENETSARARIVIPAKSFLEKDDVRLSYGHHYVTPMQQVTKGEFGISEYAFVQGILERLAHEKLKPEADYLDAWLRQCPTREDGTLCSPDYQALPYADGFGKSGEEAYVFMDALDDDREPKTLRNIRAETHQEVAGSFWLLTPKGRHTLNTQFRRPPDVVHVPPTAGWHAGARVRVISDQGALELTVLIDPDLRDDCVCIPIGTPGVNRLTFGGMSHEGGGACYGDTHVRLVPADVHT